MISEYCLLFQPKSWVGRGAYNHSALWVIVGLLVKHFIVLTALWMKEMRNWGRSGMTSYCSIVCSGSGSPSTSPVLGLLPIVHNLNKYNDLGSALSGGDLGLWQSNLTSWLQIWGSCCHSSELQMSYPTHEVSPHPRFNLPPGVVILANAPLPSCPSFSQSYEP